MKYILVITLALFSLPAHAEFGFGGAEIGKPQSMMVAGESVIDEQQTNASDTASEQTNNVQAPVIVYANPLQREVQQAPPTFQQPPNEEPLNLDKLYTDLLEAAKRATNELEVEASAMKIFFERIKRTGINYLGDKSNLIKGLLTCAGIMFYLNCWGVERYFLLCLFK